MLCTLGYQNEPLSHNCADLQAMGQHHHDLADRDDHDRDCQETTGRPPKKTQISKTISTDGQNACAHLQTGFTGATTRLPHLLAGCRSTANSFHSSIGGIQQKIEVKKRATASELTMGFLGDGVDGPCVSKRMSAQTMHHATVEVASRPENSRRAARHNKPNKRWRCVNTHTKQINKQINIYVHVIYI